MIAAGIGFASKATSNQIIAAVDECAASLRLHRSDISVIATADFKSGSKALRDATRELGIDTASFDKSTLQAQEERLKTRSKRSIDRAGVSCLAEAAALAAAGATARLVSARIICGPVTCAIAKGGKQ